MALTSASVTGAQAVQVGLATHCIPGMALDSLVDELSSALQDETSESADACSIVGHCLSLHAVDIDPGHEPHASFRQLLDRREVWFVDDDPASIAQRLRDDAELDTDAAHLLELLQGASPWSLHTTVGLFRRAAGLDLAGCLQLEYATAQVACRHPDLIEGVRAVLVDKDRNPAWASADAVELQTLQPNSPYS